MAPVNGTKKSYKVKSVKKDHNRWYYVVEEEGVEYLVKLFEFQKKNDIPEEVICMVKTDKNDGTLRIAQDLVPIIASRYSVGSTYSFCIKSSNERYGQYDAISSEGLLFHLLNPKNKTYKDRSMVMCRVLSIDGIRVNVTEEEAPAASVEANRVTPETIKSVVDGCDIPPHLKRYCISVVRSSDGYQSVRNSMETDTPNWLSELLSTMRTEMPVWLHGNLTSNHKKDLLKALRALCLELVERSGLIAGSSTDMQILQWEIGETIHAANEYLEAIDILKEERASKYAADIARSLQSTGYIHEPWHRLQVLASAMALNEELRESAMPEILEILAKGDIAIWQRHPLRGALTSMINRYVEQCMSSADRVTDIKNGDNNIMITSIVRALVMVMLLSDGEDDLNRHVCMARLCRYASLVNDAFSATLNDRAFGYLFGRLPNTLPFGWGDLAGGISVICYKLAQAAKPLEPDTTVYYEGAKAVLDVNNTGICLRPAYNSHKHNNVVPSELSGRRKMRVITSGKKETKVPKEIETLCALWNDIATSFYSEETQETATERQKEKMPADVGDVVFIRITGRERYTDKSGNPKFRCVIEDDKYEGSGSISPRDIVHYNVPGAQLSDFLDEEGRSLLLEAEVDYIGANDECHFKLLERVDQFVGNYAQVGSSLLCRMTICRYGDSLLISQDGYSVKIPKSDGAPELANGELVWVETTAVYADGKVDATFLERAEDEEQLSESYCLRNILRLYADGRYYDAGGEAESETSDEDRQNRMLMERAEAVELMCIMAREGSIAGDSINAANYLSMAKMIATAIGCGSKAAEYAQRIEIIGFKEQYVKNKMVDYETFSAWVHNNKETLSKDVDMLALTLKLVCVCNIDRHDSERTLLNIAQKSHGSETATIAKLILAYNLTKELGFEEMRAALLQKTDTIMGVNS